MKPWIWFVLFGLVLATLVGWRIKSNAGEGEEQGGARGRRTPVVEVALAGPATIQDTIEAVGSLESPHLVELSPKSSGRIERVSVREGDRVRAGQVLATIDTSEADAQVVQAMASVAEAKSRLAEARLGQGPSRVGVATSIEQQEANVSSAEADLEQVKRNSESTIEAARANIGDVTARLRGAESQVENAQAVLDRERASLRNAETKLERTRDLYRQGFIAAQEVDDAKTAVDVQAGNVRVAESQLSAARQAKTSADALLEVARLQLTMAERKAKADVAAAEARLVAARSGLKVANANEATNPAYTENLLALEASVRAAEAQLDLADSVKSNTVLTSPMDGVVTARNADPGSLATPGQAVLIVQSLEWLFFRASLPVEASSLVRDGQTVMVEVDGVEDPIAGTVSQVNLVADVQSRQFSVQVRLENKDQALRPGMFGKIKIVTREVDAEVVVPKESVRDSQAGPTVTVIGDDNKAQVRQVKTGASDGRMVEVTEGVAAGERVVTLSFMPLRDGQDVNVPETEKRE
ncbi:MAG: efflux RND transporter periplasmic adaptor subunit [Fimbriimonadaceae bacterium]